MKTPGRGATRPTTALAEQPETHPAIGLTVVVDTGDGVGARGVIVDDFGDLAGTPVGIGTERVATARRWAVDIDGGHIVFVDDAALLEIHPEVSDS
ncbi:hypothetical protein [Williamsia maris]|uniref:PRC-barrel domain-containing protein n=1 Tax=Williamsia maris TaxID=72806 RepID=A0ABT1HGV7_9NOCA|nr:hypothetical protein [Williamsia maris]MCP2176146.1 hypothetical protein [Williamsia maris]